MDILLTILQGAGSLMLRFCLTLHASDSVGNWPGRLVFLVFTGLQENNVLVRPFSTQYFHKYLTVSQWDGRGALFWTLCETITSQTLLGLECRREEELAIVLDLISIHEISHL